MKKSKLILKFIIGIVLLALSLFLMKETFILGIISVLVANIYKRRFFEGLARIGDIFTAGAYCIDVFGCVVLQVPLNWLFLSKNSKHKFGSKYETISYVLGKNQINTTLTKVGKGLVAILNFLDPGHCLNTVIDTDGIFGNKKIRK